MTTFAEVIKAAIPNADEDTCDFVLWNRTPYPMGKLTARSLFKAASRFYRAGRSGIHLCDFCERQALPDKYQCQRCNDVLQRSAAA